MKAPEEIPDAYTEPTEYRVSAACADPVSAAPVRLAAVRTTASRRRWRSGVFTWDSLLVRSPSGGQRAGVGEVPRGRTGQRGAGRRRVARAPPLQGGEGG